VDANVVRVGRILINAGALSVPALINCVGVGRRQGSVVERSLASLRMPRGAGGQTILHLAARSGRVDLLHMAIEATTATLEHVAGMLLNISVYIQSIFSVKVSLN
jgi:hypothetical protein